MKERKFLVLFVFIFLFSGFVSAQDMSYSDGYHSHDGIFLRLSGGLGYSALFSTEDVVSGISTLTVLSIGGAVKKNLIVNVEFYGSKTLDYTYTTSGDLSDSFKYFDMTFSGVGLGMTYYSMPGNSYFSASVGFGAFGLQDGLMGASSEYKSKISFNFTFGKEWWVSDNWGIGVGGQLFYSPVGKTGLSYSDYEYDEDSDSYSEPEDCFVHFLAGGVILTATYN